MSLPTFLYIHDQNSRRIDTGKPGPQTWVPIANIRCITLVREDEPTLHIETQWGETPFIVRGPELLPLLEKLRDAQL